MYNIFFLLRYLDVGENKIINLASFPIVLAHLPLTENRLKFFDRMNLTNNYESTYIW